MFNASFTENAAPAAFGVLELIADPHAGDADHRGLQVIERAPRERWSRRHAPLERTTLGGTITGPLAALRLVQRFRVTDLPNGAIEARYRFPLPGDAAVLGVVVRFGDTTVHTTLAERGAAREQYDAAKAQGFQAALLERESPSVFTLSITGLRDAEAVEVETRYVQRAASARGRWSLRVPLTTAPRYVRPDEAGLAQANGNPLRVFADAGHTFRLDVTMRGVGALDVSSPTHPLRVEPSDGGAVRVTLAADEVVPDRDCVLEWKPAAAPAALHVVTEDGPDGAHRYALALVTPPAAVPNGAPALPRDLLLLVDRSGSMSGPKWEATRWAVRRLLGALGATDRFQLGLFDNAVVWLDGGALPADASTRARAERFLDGHGPNGGTELGMSLEAALARPRAAAEGAARHCLIVTDGQVTDEGRILATLDREATRADARRVSVLCIDSAPNASLATAIADRGRGGAHFLSSHPSDADVATALDDALARFAAPSATGLALDVDRGGVEAPTRAVRHVDAGPSHPSPLSRVDLGDLVAGHPAWVVLRLPASAAAGAAVSVRGAGLDPLTVPLPAPSADAWSVRAAFGAERVRVLEQLLAGRATTSESVRAELARLGYDLEAVGASAGSTVYAENAAAAAQSALRALVVRESLEAGVPSTLTSFVAVREVAGAPPVRTDDVACALPAGWSGAFETAAAPGFVGGSSMFTGAMPIPASPALDMAMYSPMPAMPRTYGATPSAPPAASTPGGGVFDAVADLARETMGAMRSLKRRGRPARRDEGDGGGGPTRPLFDGAPPSGAEVVLFDSADDASPIPPHIARAIVSVSGDAGAVGPDAELLLYVGDLAQPVARIALATVLAWGGERPLNVRRAGGERVRLVLSLGAGASWPKAAGKLTVTLGG